MVAKASSVFAAEQVDGYVSEDVPPQDHSPALEDAERFITATAAVIRNRGERAFYSPATDEITLPPRPLFRSTPTSTATESYYATAFHELGHWTGASSRLAREFGKRFGDKAYAEEELTAELTAAFLCAALQVSNRPRLDHAQYAAVWLKLLRTDNRAIFIAASKASQAVRFLQEKTARRSPRADFGDA